MKRVAAALIVLLAACHQANAATVVEEAPVTTTTSTTTTSTSTTTTTTSTTTTTTLPAPVAVVIAPSPSLPSDPLGRVQAAFDDVIPPAWRDAVPAALSLRPGATSKAYNTGFLVISEYHANGPYARLRFIVAHEFGHMIAYQYGTHRYLGAPPDGWPGTSNDAELWGDCVGQVFAGYAIDAHDCGGADLAFTAAFLAEGPP